MSLGVIFRFCFAICRTAATRATISLRVKPSGKTTRSTGSRGTTRRSSPVARTLADESAAKAS